MGASQEGFVQLASRAASVLEHIQKRINPEDREIGEDITQNLEDLYKCGCFAFVCSSQRLIREPHRLINDIQRDVERELQRPAVHRFFHQASITSTLNKRTQDLQDAREQFNVQHRDSFICCILCSLSVLDILIDGMPDLPQKKCPTTG